MATQARSTARIAIGVLTVPVSDGIWQSVAAVGFLSGTEQSWHVSIEEEMADSAANNAHRERLGPSADEFAERLYGFGHLSDPLRQHRER